MLLVDRAARPSRRIGFTLGGVFPRLGLAMPETAGKTGRRRLMPVARRPLDAKCMMYALRLIFRKPLYIFFISFFYYISKIEKEIKNREDNEYLSATPNSAVFECSISL
jgi:hypothetical protein